jgi:hypothetical protein
MQDSRPRRLAWLISVAAWDGALPLFVAGGTLLVANIDPRPRGIMVPFAATCIPVGALIVRGGRGFRDLARFGPVRLFSSRVIAFCIGLFLLLTIEAISSVLYLDGFVPSGGDFLFLGCVYLVYFLLMAIAFRPSTGVRSSDSPTASDNPFSYNDSPRHLR